MAAGSVAVSQFLRHTPLDPTPFARVIPLAGSGAPQPVVGGLDRQLPDRRDPQVDGDSATRQAATVALVKPAVAPGRSSASGQGYGIENQGRQPASIRSCVSYG
jgi:hypothetical protein